MYKTTRRDEDYFAERVRYWIKRLSLGDWKIEIYRKKLIEASAACEMWQDAHGAHIMLNTELDYTPGKPWLDRLALHEAGHVLLYDFKQLINSRVVTESMTNTTEHAVIRRLENAL